MKIVRWYAKLNIHCIEWFIIMDHISSQHYITCIIMLIYTILHLEMLLILSIYFSTSFLSSIKQTATLNHYELE